MKDNKKQKMIFPEVHVLGDLQDVKNLVEGVNKKRTIVVFQDGEQGTFYIEIEGEINQILQEDITNLEQDYRLIFFSFFPGQKKVVPLTEEIPDIQVPEPEVQKDEESKKARKGKKEKKAKKAKKKKEKRKRK